MKTCKKCNINKPFNEYYKQARHKHLYRSYCKECCVSIQKNRQDKDPKKHYSHTFKYKKKTNYDYNRKQNNPLIKLAFIVRSRLRSALKAKQWSKTSNFYDYIGCSLEELKNHIEKQFQPGMTWENHGLKTWHIDHIKSLSLAKTEEEMYKLCHYTNLQPLWAKDNLRKSNKLIY
jgi:hypothetical protein